MSNIINMSKPRFIAIEEPLPSGRYGYTSFDSASSSRVHLMRIKDIYTIECDDKSCYLDIGAMQYIVSKSHQPNTYRNLIKYSQSNNVFRATKDDN